MQLPKVTSEMDTKELANLVAILIKELTWLMNGHINANHIQAKSVTAEKMKVNELSAISADLGTILAGAIYGILIEGSQIQTKEQGDYPRVELTSTQNLLRAESSATDRIQISALGESSSPAQYYLNSLVLGMIQAINSTLLITTAIGRGEIQINSGRDLKLGVAPGRHVMFESWNSIYSVTDNSGQTLKQALDSLSARVDSLSLRIAALGG